jgi:hypothetical protein
MAAAIATRTPRRSGASSLVRWTPDRRQATRPGLQGRNTSAGALCSGISVSRLCLPEINALDARRALVTSDRKGGERIPRRGTWYAMKRDALDAAIGAMQAELRVFLRGDTSLASTAKEPRSRAR